ncbi:MAG TPA: purine-nucleoside phosphorylase [Flavitalea sp.]|nr:purine-nucleoside phosphorylase [Flavitalea sp.]
MSKLIHELQETVAFIRSRYPAIPVTGIVLGSGLGNFLNELTVEASIPYSEIPHFPLSTVKGHAGSLVFGKLSGKIVVVMAGRFHFYEGYSAADVAYPIRVLKLLGIEQLLLSNAAGGVNPAFRVGDLMIVRDHISMAITNPLLGVNEDELGPRFPDMSEPYSLRLIGIVKKIGEDLKIGLHEGVYFGVTGPTFETKAEYKMIKFLGADAVGMSTVQETIVAIHMGLPVFAISVITDLGITEHDQIITHEDVLAAARNAEPLLTAIFKQLVAKL